MNHTMNQMFDERDDEMFDRYEEELEKQIQLEEKERDMKCEAENYGKCGGPLTTESVVWHVRPRQKDLARGHYERDTTLDVNICAKHHKQITDQYCNRTTLPDLYGWDKWDALDGLTAYLHYTGFNPVYCACLCRIKDTVSDTGACTKSCESLLEQGARWYTCRCTEPVVCTCASFGNNELHWALLTYVNGFNFYEEEISSYSCDACVQPSWRDTHEFYKNSLVSEEEIMAIAQKDPRLIYQENAKGMTPFALIEPMIKHLEYVRKDYYVKCAESGWAGSNIHGLVKIKRGLSSLTPSQGEERTQTADAEDQDECEDAGVLWWN